MSMVIKGAVMAAGAAVLSTGSYFALRGLGYTPMTLLEDSNKTETYSEGKLGKDFEHFLVSPFHKDNERFWNESFRKWETESKKTTPNLSNEFKDGTKVKKGFAESSTSTATDDTQALNRVCYSLYTGKSKSDLSVSDSETDTNKKKLTSDLFTYCSALGGLPQTVKNDKNKASYDTNKIGKTKEEKLIALNGNDRWWELKTKEFFGGSAPDDSAKFFKKFHTDENKTPNKQSLRTRCAKAYDQTSASTADEQATDTGALKYCSLLGS